MSKWKASWPAALGAVILLTATWPGPAVQAAPADPYLAAATRGPRPVDAEGFLKRWLLLEPISKPNRSNAGFTGTYVRQALTAPAFPGQFTALPRPGDRVDVGGPLQWRAMDAIPFDVKLFNFAQDLNKPTYGVIFWAVTVVDSPRELKGVRLAVGSNGASMWWVDGEEAADLFGDRRMVVDDVVSRPLTLHKGKNVVRGAVINGPGLSDVCVRFLDAQGRPVTDLTTEAM